MSNTPVLSVKDVEIVYTQNKEIVHAVNGVSFEIEKGQTLGLVGETGAGKTTIAKSILRVLPNPPAIFAGGEILLDGENIMEKSEKEMLDVRGKRVAMIFQDPMTALNPVMTVGDQIAEMIYLHNDCSRAESMKRAKEMLQTVGIDPNRSEDYPHQFSGGQRQRIGIARALTLSPRILVCDEPAERETDGIVILPWRTFVERLWSGLIF